MPRLVSFLRHNVCLLLSLLAVVMFFPTVGFGQYWGQPQFSITPAVIDQGACYTISVPNWAPSYNGWGSPTLNVGYYTSWSGYQYIYYWPSLDWNGNALICTDVYTVPGTYNFNLVSNTYYWQWWGVSASVTVNAPAPPPQPTSLSFSNSQGYAGNDCYVMTVGNGANMTIDLSYTFNGISQPTWSTALDGNGQWSYCLNHYDRVGRYDFYQMKNHQASDWVNTSPSPPVTYVVKYPQPKSFNITAALITQGQSYTIVASNGADVTLDEQYTLNGSPQTRIAWPTLGNYGAPNPDGTVAIGTDTTTPMGKYSYTDVRNTLNTAWVHLQQPVRLTICPASAPTITGITPASGAQGTNVSVTITGTDLCSVSLSTTAGGLTLSNVVWDSPFTSVTATFNIASTAAPGAATITLTTPVSSASTQFMITAPTVLTKEYIYLGTHVLAVVSASQQQQSPPLSSPVSATGGTITSSGGYTMHTFTASGTFTVLGGSGNVEVTVLGGGGGGGGGYGSADWGVGGGGGGGAGQYIVSSLSVTSGNTFTVTVGNAGQGGAAYAGGDAGGSSAFGVLLKAAGGSGGGAGQVCYYGAGGSAGGGGTANGGNGGKYCGGGLGSAGGGSANSGTPGSGGLNEQNGDAGGGGGGGSSSTLGSGGNGGRAGGWLFGPAFAGASASGYGAGGGGGGGDGVVGRPGALGGNGGAAIVVVRYPTAP